MLAGGRPQTRAVDELRQGRVDSSQTLTLSQLTRLRASDHNEVLAGAKLSLDPLERLPQQSLDAISLDRTPYLPRHRQAKPRPVDGGIGKAIEHQVTISRGATMAIDPLELGATRQAPASVATAASRMRLHL